MAMARVAWTLAVAHAACLDSQACVEEEEAMELAQLRTQLLQVKMELSSSSEEAEGVYGKLLVDSPSWCGHIPWIVQFVVPPCWFGKPDRSDEPKGPDGKPAWCQHVYQGAKPYVEECTTLGSGPPPVSPAAAAPAAPAAAPAKKPARKPDWCAHLPEASKKYTPDCNDQIESLWLRQRESNWAWRPEAAVLMELDHTQNSSSDVVYGKLMTSAPHWCGYIPWLVQFVVPPCWFGKPEPSEGPLGPDGKPEWCKWVSQAAMNYVADCRGGMYDHRHPGDDLGAGPPPHAHSGAKPDWCSHVAKESLRYVPDCNSQVESLW